MQSFQAGVQHVAQLVTHQVDGDDRHQQRDAGIDIIPSNDFSFYDQVLDMTALLGAVPGRFGPVGEPLFYAVAGIAWIPVAMLVIWWMARPDADDDIA